MWFAAEGEFIVHRDRLPRDRPALIKIRSRRAVHGKQNRSGGIKPPSSHCAHIIPIIFNLLHNISDVNYLHKNTKTPVTFEEASSVTIDNFGSRANLHARSCIHAVVENATFKRGVFVAH